jgi:hypothetical protein
MHRVCVATFGESGTLHGATVTGIFDMASDLTVDGVLSTAPVWRMLAADAPSAAAGQTLVARGVTYKVRQVILLPADGSWIELVLARG